METKICCCCKEEKTVDHFSKCRSQKDGLKRYCKECAAKQGAKYRAEHKEEIREKKKISYEKSKEKSAERTENAISEGTRTCSMCGAAKPIREFYPRGNGGFYTRCKQCEHEAQKRFREANTQTVAEQKHRYNRERKEKIDEYNHRYYREHAGEAKERTKCWVAGNKERARKNSQRGQQRRRAKGANLTCTFSRHEWETCKEFFTGPDGLRCAYCGKALKRATQDHVIPLSAGGAYVKENIIPACQSCNSSKCDKPVWDWYREQPFYSPDREEKIRSYLKAAKND